MRLLDPASARRVPWKNGRGSTLELASDASAPGGDWTWRLSLADVPERTPFSLFPGVDRLLACLEGPGLFVERGGARLRVPDDGDALAFPGEDLATGDPLGPGVRDAGLMLRRDSWRGSMTLARGASRTVSAPLVLVHAAGFARAETATGARELGPGFTLVAGGRVAVTAAPGAAAVICALRPRAA